jgi:SagB-type dehydrogenase family enzyme
MPAEVASFLCLLGDWVSAKGLTAAYPELGSEFDIARLLAALHRVGLAEREDDDPGDSHDALPWKSEAGIFHFATRDPLFPRDPLSSHDVLAAKAKTHPPPKPLKTVRGRRVRLPPPQDVRPLGEVLRARRTWRRFAKRPVTLQHIATLLQLTWGVQHHVRVPGQGNFVLKTSPSGGARHPLEAYLLALNVRGLPRGVYHYAAGEHQLVDLRRPLSRARVTSLLANQYYFAEAAAVFVMSAVFARTMWKYEHSRAYRAILAEAGHFAQTFCIVATALTLAPFCTMAFSDTPLETLLGVDGLSESALYVVGVGARSEGPVTLAGRVRRPSRA